MMMTNIPTQTCWGCKHFWISAADGPYSEETPGSDFAIYCNKNVWSFDPYETDKKKFSEIMETGFNCKLFEKNDD